MENRKGAESEGSSNDSGNNQDQQAFRKQTKLTWKLIEEPSVSQQVLNQMQPNQNNVGGAASNQFRTQQ